VNGFICEGSDDAVRAVSRLPEIDRAVVRDDCARRFGKDVIVDQYAALYARVVGARP